MRVLLIHPNDHSGGAEAAGNWPPAWVADLTGTLKAGGYDDVHCVGAMTHHLRDAQVRARIEELHPGIVGCTAITPAIHKAEGLLQIAKDVNPEIVTVLGGIHGTCRYPQVLKEAPWIDAKVVATPSEPTIQDLDRIQPDRGILEWHKYIYIPVGVRVAILNFARGRVGHWGPRTKKSVDFAFDKTRTFERPDAQVLETQCEACGDAACCFEIRWQGRCGSPRPGAPPKIGLPLAARVVCRSPPPNRPLP